MSKWFYFRPKLHEFIRKYQKIGNDEVKLIKPIPHVHFIKVVILEVWIPKT